MAVQTVRTFQRVTRVRYPHQARGAADAAAPGRGVAGAFDAQRREFAVGCRLGPGAYLAVAPGKDQPVGTVCHGEELSDAGGGGADDPLQSVRPDLFRHARCEAGPLVRVRGEEPRQSLCFRQLRRQLRLGRQIAHVCSHGPGFNPYEAGSTA